MCQGPIFVKYGECGEELKKWLIEVYVPPTQGDYPDYSSSSEESSEIEGKPTKWNQHYVKYINGLQADIEMRKNRENF